MNIVRRHRLRNYAIIPNAALEDDRLSFRARGILAYLLSRPDGWKTDSTRLAAAAKAGSPERGEGRDAVRTALTELETVGYLLRETVQTESGQWITVCSVGDEPAPENPSSGTEKRPPPAPEKPASGNQALSTSRTENNRKPAGIRTDGAERGCAAHGSRRPGCPDCQRVMPIRRSEIRPPSPEIVAQARKALGK